METANKTQLDFISEAVASIYTLTITTKENKFRSTMKRLREMLLNKTRDASAIDRNTLSGILWYAVLDRDITSIRELIQYEPDVNYVRSEISMLWMAMIHRDVDIAKVLIESGADVNERISKCGPSFLHFLVTMDDDPDSFELAKLMIERGADVNACVDGCSVLATAVTHAAVAFVEMLLTSGAHFKVNYILLAAQTSKPAELMPILIDSLNEDDDTVQLFVFSLLQYFIEEENVNLDAIKALLSYQLPVLNLDIEGWTVFNIAMHYGKTEVIKLVLDYGFNVNQRSIDGHFPLYWAASYGDSRMAEFLIANGSDVHQHNNYGRYAIHNACVHNSAENIDLLLRFGADINVTDYDGATPFSLLVDDGTLNQSHQIIIKHLAILASSGTPVNECDLEKICENPDMLAYYEECLNQLVEE